MGWTQNGVWFNWKKIFFQCSNQSCCPKFVESNSAKLHWKYEQSSYPGSSFDEKT